MFLGQFAEIYKMLVAVKFSLLEVHVTSNLWEFNIHAEYSQLFMDREYLYIKEEVLNTWPSIVTK